MRRLGTRTRRPPNYPAELESDLTLSDGRVVHLRPVVPSDAPQLKAAIETADAETIRARFLGGRPPTDEETIRRLVTVDYDRRLAIAAFDPDGKGVGITRYEGREGSDVAEVAVAVDPAWRNVGLASGLLRALAEAALQRGISHFSAVYFSNNIDVSDIVNRSGLSGLLQREGDVVDEILTLDQDRLDTLEG